MSWDRKRRNDDISKNRIAWTIGIVAAVSVFIAVPWKVSTVFVSTTESIFASFSSTARSFADGARCLRSAIVVWRARV